MDRFEWDLSSPLTPELFATLLVRDLSLPSSASPIIAHAIHEELFKQKKTCLEMGLVGQNVDDYSNRKRGARVLEGVWREWTEALNYGPRVETLSLDEMDRVEADRDRAIRSVVVLYALRGLILMMLDSTDVRSEIVSLDREREVVEDERLEEGRWEALYLGLYPVITIYVVSTASFLTLVDRSSQRAGELERESEKGD